MTVTLVDRNAEIHGKLVAAQAEIEQLTRELEEHRTRPVYNLMQG